MTTKDRWDAILSRIVPHAPLAHIAGGAIRDRLTGVDVKDIDVFLPAGAPVGVIEMALSDLYRDGKVNDCSEYTEWNSAVAQTADYTPIKEGFPPLNIITLNERLSVKENMERFDFGICKVAYTLGVSIHTTPEFWEDFHNNTFTVTRVENHAQIYRTLERFKRISARYPGWRLVLPQAAVAKLVDSSAEWLTP